MQQLQFMKKTVLMVLAMILGSHVNAQWSLTWQDEFNGTGIDAANWAFETGTGYNGWGNNELQYYTNRSDNATVSNGNLLIIAKKEPMQGSDYTSARMITKGLQSWTYGKMEARIRLPEGQGTWPAFWMLGQNISTAGWPQCGEIDIMEHINSEGKIYGTMHWDNNGHAKYGGDVPCNVSQYHLYSVEWDKYGIRWFLDGSAYWEGDITGNVNGTEEFHRPFFILLNLAVGGNWPGPPNAATVFPDTMFVDYVRVYQKTSGMNENMNINNFMHVSPDTGTGNLTIEITHQPVSRNVGITICNVNGQNIKSLTTSSSLINLDISGFSSGMYFVKARAGEEMAVRKFIKQ
jgi:beta-glucanase (GH16 family)